MKLNVSETKVSVIIPNWNGKHFLKDCLSSLNKQTFKDFEVVLVDNGLLCLYGLYKVKLTFKEIPLYIKAATLFTLVALVSLVFTPLHLNLSQYLNSFFYTVRFFSYIIFGLLLINNAFPQLSKNLHKVLIFSGLGLSILGILQFVIFHDLSFIASQGWDGHIFRAVSTFLDPNFLGGFLVLTLIVIIQKFSLPKKYHVLTFAIIYLTLLLTFSRSSYLMFLLSFLTISFFKHSIKFIVITLILFGGLLGGFRIYELLVSTPRNIDRVQSAKYRIDSWQQGLVLFQRYPTLGVGYNTYRYALNEYKLAPNQFIQSHGASANDSSLLHVASTTGTLGFLSFISFLGILIWQDYKKNFSKKTGGIITAAILGLLIHSTFANSLFYPFILIWLVLAFKIHES